jgi:mono/diheme cytochrome c family protein
MTVAPALLIVILALLAAMQSTAVAIDLRTGEALVARDCSSCHAIGRSGASPSLDAPAFHTLGTRYPIESLEEALGEGMMSGHPDMPEFKYDADEVGAIIDYLKSIQKR